MAISRRVSKFGCIVLVHHFETVQESLPSSSASHLFVRWFPTRTTFKRLMHVTYFCFLTMKQFFYSCKNTIYSWYKRRFRNFYAIYDNISQKLNYDTIIRYLLSRWNITHYMPKSENCRCFALPNLAAPWYSSNDLSSSNSVTTRQNANKFASALAAPSFGSTLGLHKLSTLRLIKRMLSF